MSDDWLEPPGADEDLTPNLPAVVALPDDYPSRLKLVEECWARLTPKQKTFLSAWRDCRYNARAACRQLGLSEKTRPMTAGMQYSDFATVVRIWQANAAANALDRDRLLARQDDIVETLLTPRPILHQGIAVFDPKRPGEILTEVEAGAAARANETLLQAAGVIKTSKDVEVNVGVAVQVGPPTLNIQVLPLPPSKQKIDDRVVIDAKFTEVPSDEWLDT